MERPWKHVHRIPPKNSQPNPPDYVPICRIEFKKQGRITDTPTQLKSTTAITGSVRWIRLVLGTLREEDLARRWRVPDRRTPGRDALGAYFAFFKVSRYSIKSTKSCGLKPLARPVGISEMLLRFRSSI